MLRFKHPATIALLLAGLASSACWVAESAAQSLTRERVCEVLQLDTTDCALISSVRDNAHPWRVSNFMSIDGDYLFSATSDVAPGMASCLSLDIAEGALPANSRIDFQWDPILSFEGESLRFYINNTVAAAHNVIGGPIGDWHLQQRFSPAAVTELRWCVERSDTASTNRSVGNGALDLLSFHPAAEAALIADNATLCAALDLGDCSQLEAFSRDPAVLSWQITDSQSLSGTTALAIPSTVLDSERTCLTIDVNISGRQSLGFNWRLDAPETSTLSLLVNGSERQTLSGTGEDSLWQAVAIFSPVPIESISWCYASGDSAAIARGAWVDALSTGLAVLSVESISQLVQSAGAETLEDLATWEFSLTISDPSGTALPMELSLLSTGEIGATAVSFSANTVPGVPPAVNRRQFNITTRLMPGVELINRINGTLPVDLIENYRLATDNLSSLNFDLSAYTRLRFCETMGIKERECALITGIESDEFPWQFTEEGTFSGMAVQSYVGLDHNQRSQLTLTLAAGVTAVSLYRRVSSQSAWDFLAIEYNDNERRFVGELFAPQSYLNLPFFDGDGNRVQGDVSGSVVFYTFGDKGDADANTAINLGPEGAYSHLQLFPGEAIRSLRLLYRKDNALFFGLDRGWVDSLQLYASGAEVSPSAGAELCAALEMRDRDCALISTVTTTAGAPWSISSFGLQLSGRYLRSAFEFAEGARSCLNLQLSPPLPAATRIDFAWRITGSGSNDDAFFYLNDALAAQSGNSLPWHSQQRLSEEPVNTLSWCFMRSSSGNFPPHQLIDRLQFTEAAAARPGPNELCEVLDIPPANCLAAGSFSQNPATLSWRTSTAQSLVGGSALQIPLTVLAGERSCLELTAVLAVGDTVSFSWRSATASGSALNFLVGGSETATLSGDGSDSGWQFVTYSADAAVNSLSWCYSVSSGIEDISDNAWLDSLALGSAVRIQRISEPLLVQREQNRLTYDFELVLENTDGTALQADVHNLGLAISNHSTGHIIVDTSVREQRADGSRLLLEATAVVELLNPVTTSLSWNRFAIIGLPSAAYNLPPITLSVPAQAILCDALELSVADCELILEVENNTDYPWQFTSEGTFSGTGLQSNPALPHSALSDLRFTLAPAVAAVEFYRRVSSQGTADWLIFEYNGIPRGNRAFSESSYLSLPFFGAEGTPVQGDLSGSPHPLSSYGFGDFSNADATVNLGPGGEYSLLRLLPDTPLTLTELRWIYRKDDNHSLGEDRAWIDRLQLYPAVTTSTQLCATLDLNAENCPLTTFTPQPTNLQWTVDDAAGLMASRGSALRVPFRVSAGQSACLTVTTDPSPMSRNLGFRWRGGSLSGSQLSFRVNGNEVETLAGSADAGWEQVIYSAETDITSLAWCYSHPSGNDQLSQGWIDALTFAPSLPLAQTRISTVSPATVLQSTAEGTEFRFVVVLDDLTDPPLSVTTPEPQLTATAPTELTTWIYTVMTGNTGSNNARQFTYTLTAVVDIPLFQDTAELGISFTATMTADGITAVSLPTMTAHRQRLCLALDLSTEDCAVISSFSSTADSPWQIAETGFQSGSNLLTSAAGVADAEQSCLMLELSAAAAAVRRLDFTWAADSAAGDQLQLTVNEQPLAFNSGLLATAPHERQQRLLTAAPTAISWCYRKDASGSAGADRGWLDNLSFHRTPAATLLPADRDELCAVLNLVDNCELIRSFTQQHSGSGTGGLSWAVTDSESVAGGSSLRSPLTVPETAESCLVLTLEAELPVRTELRFQWRVDSATDTDFLRLRAGATELRSISGPLTANPWRAVSHTLTQASDELSWCFDDDGAASAGASLGWVDSLQLLPPLPQFAIAAESPPVAQPILGRYRFSVTARDNNQSPGAAEARAQLQLMTSRSNNIVISTITSSFSDTGDKVFTVTVQLRSVSLTGSLTIQLSHSDPMLLAAEGTERNISFAALTAEQSICMALDLSTRDCALISSFSTSNAAPWEVVSAAAFRTGSNLLASSAVLPDDEQSCLNLNLTNNALTTGSRIDFSWAVDSAAGDSLQFSINGFNITAIAGPTVPGHRQQRFTGTAVNWLSWCYSKDSAGSTGEDRGWLDNLSLHPAAEATLLSRTDQQTLCTALDLSTADCAALSNFSQRPSSLSWSPVTDIALQGDSSLQSPATVVTGESSCLGLSITLPAGTAINFAWRVDSASSSALSLQVNGTAVPNISISGAVADVAGDGWQVQSYTHATALSTVGWCYNRGAMFAGVERGWVDRLSLEPPFSYPQIILDSTPTRMDSNSPWVFDLTVLAAAGTTLPTGLEVILARGINLSTITLSAGTRNSVALEMQVTAITEDDSDPTVMRFGLSGLPPAVEPLTDGLTVVIEAGALTQVIPLLQALSDDGSATERTSLNDLLTGLNLVAGSDGSALNLNLPGTNSNFNENMMKFLSIRDIPRQREVLDVDSSGSVDTIDFRLMLRYAAGLRGPALCDELCRIKLRSLLEP